MNGLAVGVQEAAIGMVIILFIAISVVLFIILIAYIFRVKTGRILRLKIAAKKILIWSVVLLVAGTAWKYQSDVRMRAKAQACTHELSPDDGGRYRAEQCSLGGYVMLLRVYEARTGQLLAERTYSVVDTPELIWTSRGVFDRFGPEEMVVRLPPTLLDRVRASMP
jgi:hypothetical protein